MYSLVWVLTRIMSPWFINNGTFIFAPVSTVTIFVPPFELSPFMPGAASVTSRSIFIGIFNPIIFSLNSLASTVSFGLVNFKSFRIVSVGRENLCDGLFDSQNQDSPLFE